MKKINYDLLNDIMYFSKKILKLIYIFIIAIIIFVGIRLIKEIGILGFLLKVFSILSPLFIGFGIAWISPMGPLKFSIATPLNDKEGDDVERFQFQIGTGF
jgi:hypothetical protein